MSEKAKIRVIGGYWDGKMWDDSGPGVTTIMPAPANVIGKTQGDIYVREVQPDGSAAWVWKGEQESKGSHW